VTVVPNTADDLRSDPAARVESLDFGLGVDAKADACLQLFLLGRREVAQRDPAPIALLDTASPVASEVDVATQDRQCGLRVLQFVGRDMDVVGGAAHHELAPHSVVDGTSRSWQLDPFLVLRQCAGTPGLSLRYLDLEGTCQHQGRGQQPGELQ
jgi:hypothetical protein